MNVINSAAQFERDLLIERTQSGLARAKAEGRALGRIKTIDDSEVAQWRQANSASIKTTAEHFNVSTASVKRACKALKG